MFSGGFVNRDVFYEHICDQGAVWAGTDVVSEEGMVEPVYIHTFISLNGRKRVVMALPYEDVPKQTALMWLRQLGIR